MEGVRLGVGTSIPYLENAGLWLPIEAAAELRHYGMRELLFQRGETARGVYVLRSGRVAVSLQPRTASRRGFVEVVEAGAVLGLSEAAVGGFHQMTAESLGGAEVAYLSRAKLLTLLTAHGGLCQSVRRMLCEKIDDVYQSHRLLGGPGIRVSRRGRKTASQLRAPQETPA